MNQKYYRFLNHVQQNVSLFDWPNAHVHKQYINYPYRVNVISQELNNGLEVRSELPPQAPFVIKGCNSSEFAAPFKTTPDSGDVTATDVKYITEKLQLYKQVFPNLRDY